MNGSQVALADLPLGQVLGLLKVWHRHAGLTPKAVCQSGWLVVSHWSECSNTRLIWRSILTPHTVSIFVFATDNIATALTDWCLKFGFRVAH